MVGRAEATRKGMVVKKACFQRALSLVRSGARATIWFHLLAASVPFPPFLSPQEKHVGTWLYRGACTDHCTHAFNYSLSTYCVPSLCSQRRLFGDGDQYTNQTGGWDGYDMWRVWDLRMQKMGIWPRLPGEAWAGSDMQRGPRRTVGTQACPINKDVWQRFICTATDLACSLNPFTGSWPSWVTSDAEALSGHVHRSHALPQPVLFLSLSLHWGYTDTPPLALHSTYWVFGLQNCFQWRMKNVALRQLSECGLVPLLCQALL